MTNIAYNRLRLNYMGFTKFYCYPIHSFTVLIIDVATRVFILKARNYGAHASVMRIDKDLNKVILAVR